MVNSIILTFGSLIIAHFIGDWTKLHPFHQKVVHAKIHKTKASASWICFHAGVVSFYKVLAILISYWIIPGFMNMIWPYIILITIFLGEWLTHSIFDVSKWVLNNKYKLDAAKHTYWTVIGIDQMLHYMVMLGMLYLLYCKQN